MAVLACSGLTVSAADCHVPLTVATLTDGDAIPAATQEAIRTRLQRIVAEVDGAAAGSEASRFFIAARMHHVATEVLPGPPQQTSVTTELTVYVGDQDTQTVYSTASLTLRGVGTSMQRALTSALRPLTADNPKVKALINGASDKIVAYYNRTYPQLLEKGRRLIDTEKYGEALRLLMAVPECCQGYGQAVDLGLEAYGRMSDTEGRKLYDMARAIWLSSPDAAGASAALPILTTIPLSSEARADAERLVKEIGETVKDDKKFESRRKYEDEVEMRKLRIQAASRVGEAWGRGQQPSTTNVTWIR